MSGDTTDPESNLIKIRNVLGVSSRIHELAMRRKSSPPPITKEEEMRRKMAKAKDLRAGRMNLISQKHRYVLEVAGELLNIDIDKLVDDISDSDTEVEIFSTLFEAGGRYAVMLYYSLHDPPDMDTGRYVVGQKTDKVMKLICSDGTDQPIGSKCIFVYRLSNVKAVEMKSLGDDIYFATGELGIGTALLAINNLLTEVTRPVVEISKDYGNCNEARKNDFLQGFDQFLSFLVNTDRNVCSRIVFHLDEKLFHDFLLTPQQIQKTCKNREKVYEIEKVFLGWMRQMDIALSQSQQLVRDPQNVGPSNELRYWRALLTRFAALVEFIESQAFTNVNYCLELARSKLLRKWKIMNNDITVELNITKDNVRHLSMIERFWDPLYRCEPPEVAFNIPSLLTTIRSVYRTSHFYNTSERITGFLVKVTSQIILACQNYLTNRRKMKIWDQSKHEIIKKIDICKDLDRAYRQCYYLTVKEMTESPYENCWNCSDVYIFGKLDTFDTRLNKIKIILETSITYSVLDRIRISGTEVFADKIRDLCEKISKKRYDPLAHRVPDLDVDFDVFQKEVYANDAGLQTFLKDTLSPISTVCSRLITLKRFERLKLDCLCIDRRYLDVALMLEKEMEDLKDYYNEDRANPAITWCTPPIIGRIRWARCLFKKMSDPIAILKTKECVIAHRKAQTCVKYYNYLAGVLLHYEMLHHKAWYDFAEQVRSKLETPIMTKNTKTNWLEVNFDPYISQLLKETDCMWKLNLVVPPVAHILGTYKEDIFRSFELAKHYTHRANNLRMNIPVVFLPLFRNQLVLLEHTIISGLTTTTWLSQNLHEYFDHVELVLSDLEAFLKEAQDLKLARIEEIIALIETFILVYLPQGPVGPEELFEANVKHRFKMAKLVQTKSLACERAVVELIGKFIDRVTISNTDEAGHQRFQQPWEKQTDATYKAEQSKPTDKYDWINFEKINNATSYPSSMAAHIKMCFREYGNLKYEVSIMHTDSGELFSYFNLAIFGALVKCTKLSMDEYKKRAFVTIPKNTIANEYPIPPLFKTKVVLEIPNIQIVASIRILQDNFDKITQNIIETSSLIKCWGAEAKTAERRLRPPSLAEQRADKDWYLSVKEHKDIKRNEQTFNGGMMLLEPEIKILLKDLIEKYKYLWANDREDQILAFVASSPLTADIREKFIEYDRITEEIMQESKTVRIGAIEVHMGSTISIIVEESKIWKVLLGQQLSSYYKKILDEMVEFINDQEKILCRKLNDLDDVRIAMNCLQVVRENFIRIDMALSLMEETYAMFHFFNINISAADVERVDGLRYNFQNMMHNSKDVQSQIIKLQEPLQVQLNVGVAKFKGEVEDFDVDFELKGPMVEGLPAKEASDRVLLFQGRFDELWRKYEMYQTGEKLFGLEVTEYEVLQNRKKEFNLLSKLYSLYLNVMKNIDEYSETVWSEIDIIKINTELNDFQTKCRLLPKGMKDWPAYIELKNKIDDFAESCPIVELMASEAMKPRHWAKLENLLGRKFEVESPTFTLGNVMEAPLLKYKDEIEDTCIGAVKEKDIEAKLKQIVQDWSFVVLTFAPFKTRGELLVKAADIADIVVILEDSLMVINSLASNRYNAPFKKDIMLWMSKLVSTAEILEKWLIVQALWVYLEAVFVGGDISKQLPAEAKRFAAIDKLWVRIMFKARDNPNVIECCTGDEVIKQALDYLFDQLESCQKSLTGYLEAKRLIFPRFFFVSDPVLLEILGQSSDPSSIQPHLLSIFDAMAKVTFDPESPDKIIGMASANGEKVPLDKPVICTGGVENWLGNLLSQMQDSVRLILAQMAQSFSDPEFDFIIGFQSFCGQGGLLGVQLLWTSDAELALKKSKTDKNVMRITNLNFEKLLNDLIALTVLDLTKLQRIRFETMVTIHVHQRDIFDDLVRFKIKSIIDFEWQKQARFYFDTETDECVVSITDVDFVYQNEYLGVTERLAITPLTDRCYITLAQAMGMSMGGAPAGPAGTGKTETTKDMGRTLGKLVVVFNCSDQMDFRGLGRIYKGLAQSGSWGCFDEFNRIELPVLSVAAQQIYIVLTARKEKRSFFLFSDGDTVSLNPEFGLFITMNPGYAGRQELPENLKIMFRAVSMMVPDRQIIMRVKLASCGFQENVYLARKFFVLYKLCEEQLSKQVHYDFGLRNILSVLRTLGEQKRSNPTDSEETIVMRVLKDMNLSKLIDEDEPLFLTLIEGLFPNIKLAASSKKELLAHFTNSAKKLNLVPRPSWMLKVMQLYETMLVRHGLMTLGPTGAGKSKCIQTLLDALSVIKAPHKQMRMNPKAITAPQMFGRLDVATNDWTDGIFSTLWRRSLKIKETEFCWIVLDGPVDAVWIENLNSVLDDNKTLTLANGDRIVMAPNSKLVFEPDNVDNASPATVSRVGMVFMSASVLKWDSILEGWLKHASDDKVKLITASQAETLNSYFKRIYEDAHVFVQSKLTPKMAIVEALYIRQCYDILEGLLRAEDSSAYSDIFLERNFLFSMMWSLGAVLELEDRARLEDLFLKHPSKFKWPKIQEGESLFEYVVSRTGTWEHWNSRVEEYIYPSDSVPEYSSILVPNVDNVRTAFLIDVIAKQKKAVLLIGEQGTAKTVMIKGYMSFYDPDYHLCKSMNFSSATTPNMYQRIIESYVEKRVGLSYGPPQQRKMTVFIDDINMPIVNEWGDQVTNEIVRQMMEGGGFYSLDKPGDFLIIQDVQLLGAMIHPGGGRNDIPPRLKRQFCIFNCTLPSNRSMDKIFHIMGEGYYCSSRFSEDIVAFIPKLVPLTRLLWQQTKKKMLPTPAKFHYVFNLRDLSRIWQGMLTIQGGECPDVYMVMKLWRHECTRVIADRFTEFNDINWFVSRMKAVVTENLIDDYQYYPTEETFFVDFLRDPIEPTGDEPDDFCFDAPKLYEEMPGFQATTERIFMFMAQYNEQSRGSQMDLVFFRDALIHLMIISRIVRTPRGNALLVGVGGSGKQSLTRLASFIAGYKSYQITLTKAYNATNLLDDFKYLYRTAGLEGQGITFIFTDNDIKDEGFLEFINNVLSSGEIANLFPKDELDEMAGPLTAAMKKVAPKKVPTGDILYDFFISRSRNNLHIVLCFSPVGQKFRNRSLKFPGLISGCTVDWFQKWPTDALTAVSKHFLGNFDMVATDETKQNTIEIMAFVHDNVGDICTLYFERFRRQAHVTPKSFLSFLDGYKKIYADKRNNIAISAERMTTGLIKLAEATTSTDILRKELSLKEVIITAATKEAEAVLDAVQVASEQAEVVKAEVLIAKNKAQELLLSIEADKAVAEGKLAAAQPALDEAEAALKTIKAADIATVRKLGKPPYLITLIMDVVLILFRRRMELVKPDMEKLFLVSSWEQSLKVMSDTKFLSRIVDFNMDYINAEMVDLMQPYFDYSMYTFEAAKVACGNVAGLLSWTKAMAKFYGVNKEVLPLKANLQRQEIKRDKASAEMAKLQALLDEKTREFEVHQKKYNAAMEGMQALQDEANLLKAKMDAAVSLINGLSGERTRWTQQSALFKSETNRLVGDVIILCGFLSYTGPFNQEFRSMLQKNWLTECQERKIPISSSINIIESLTDDATVGEWNIQGLPNDELSTQNGIIVTKASRYPLLIDPQSQGKTWILQREKEFGLKVTTLTNKYFRTFLEDALSLGLPLLIEDIGEELDPILDNVLEKNLIKVGSSWKVKLGEKEFDFLETFRLYLTTKLPNPLYTPEISARTSIIDFTVTIKGLEDQLLGRVILTEKRELEDERTALVQSVTANKRKQQELEINLLHKLSTTQGNLVDDVSVMQVLNTSKITSIEVTEKLAIAKTTEVAINIAREEYRPVATRGSVLYFLVCTMAMVNCMYQTSLVQFLERFDYSLAHSEKTHVTQKRIGYIIEYLTYDIFKYTSRGLYEIHKFLFVLLMTFSVDMQKGNVSFLEFQNFIKGGGALDLNLCPPKPFKWVSDATWLNLVQLSTLPQYANITNQVAENERGWKVWFEKDAPEEEPIPDGYNIMDPFHKLLIVRSWCADRTLSQSRKYLAHAMGSRFAQAVVINYDSMLEESRPLTPLICFLSMGSDPTPSIEALAKKNGIKCRSISMGQGQEIHARKLISESLEEGSWVLLQNCHLGLEYMVELMFLMMDLEKNQVEMMENFRVWITTEVHTSFPITFLQMAVKFTNEPPDGVRAGLKRTYMAMTLDMLEYSESPFYLPLIFAVSFLHTIVQERRKFGPLGWNIPYEFNSADWLSSCYFMQNHLDDLDPKRGISWSTVRYMLGEVQYGGRVTDDYDKRLLNTFAKTYFCQEMFAEGYCFFTGYQIMQYKNIEEYVNKIEELPLVDPPQVYGLHPNADITYQSNKTQEILDTIVSVQPKESSGGGGETREATVARAVNTMLANVPAPYDAFEVKKALASTNALKVFLRQEIDRIQRIILLVRATLSDLLLAIEGTIIMNEQLRDALDNIYDARVPTVWKRGSWLSSTLGFWFSELLERNTQFYNWCFKYVTKDPEMYWMTGFFNPQGFLTAMRQEVAKANKGWALDVVSLTNEVTKILTEDCKSGPAVGVYVRGLFLDGAGWDRRNNKLMEALNKVLYTAMPIIHISATNSLAPKSLKLYQCPVYKKMNRTDLNYITPLWLQTTANPDHWILRGVALLCDIK